MHGITNNHILKSIDSWKADIFADYAGSDRKDGVISPDGKRYLIKYAETHTRKNTIDTSYLTSSRNLKLRGSLDFTNIT